MNNAKRLLIEQYGEKYYNRYVGIINVIIEWLQEGERTDEEILTAYNRLLGLNYDEAWEICKKEFTVEKRDIFKRFIDKNTIADIDIHTTKDTTTTFNRLVITHPTYTPEDQEYFQYIRVIKSTTNRFNNNPKKRRLQKS